MLLMIGGTIVGCVEYTHLWETVVALLATYYYLLTQLYLLRQNQSAQKQRYLQSWPIAATTDALCGWQAWAASGFVNTAPEDKLREPKKTKRIRNESYTQRKRLREKDKIKAKQALKRKAEGDAPKV